MSTSYEEQLREQLHATTPAPYAGLDPAAIIGAGERMVRCRRIGTVLVAAAAVGGFRSGEHTYVVSVRPGDSTAGMLVDYAEKTVSGVQSMGDAGIDPADRRTTWGHGGESPVVVGVIPSASARNRIILATSGDFGGYSTDVAPIVGTEYSAFAAYFEKPLTGDAPITTALWFDASGRPVDLQGRVGSIATVGGQQAWLTADSSEFGGSQGSAFTGAADTGSMAFGDGAAGDQRTVLGLLRPTSRQRQSSSRYSVTGRAARSPRWLSGTDASLR